jgi:hypothetical protein
LVSIVPRPNLGRDEHLGSVDAGVFDCLPHVRLGAVPLGGVDEAVAALLEGVDDRLVVVSSVVAGT